MTRSRFLPALALAVGLLASAAAPAQPPGTGPAVPPLPGQGGDATIPVLPKTAGAFVTLKVSALAEHPDLKTALAQLAKQPEALAGVTELIGVSPLELDRVTLFWPRLGNGNGAPVLVVTTREPFNEARVLKSLNAAPVSDSSGRGARAENKLPAVKSAPAELIPTPKPPQPAEDVCAPSVDTGTGEPLFYALERGPFEVLFLIDDRTLMFLPGGPDGHFATVALMAASLKKNATGPLAEAIAAADKHILAGGVSLTPLLREFDRHMPRELIPYGALLSARTAVVNGDLERTSKLNLTLSFDDATAAKRAAPVLEEGIAAVAAILARGAGELKESRRPVEQAMAPLVAALSVGLKKTAARADGNRVIAATEIDVGPAVAKVIGDLLQAVQSRKKAAARMNNLKQIGLALHAYHDANNKFPSNTYGPKGEPLLSWRVQLLPYLEETELFRQFKMDEPWDGPTNKALLEKMPKVFTAPDRENAKGKTFYQGFVAPDPAQVLPAKGLFGRPWLRAGEKTGISIVSITDGTSNTLAVIEAGQGVVWSKPDDLPFGGAVPPLGEKGWDRTPALRFDGSTLLFPTTLKPDQFWPYVTIDGGEVTPDPDDNRRPQFAPQAVPAGSNDLPPKSPISPKPDGTGSLTPKAQELAAQVSELTVALRVAEANSRRAVLLAVVKEEQLQSATSAGKPSATIKALAETTRAMATAAVAETEAIRTRLSEAKAALDREMKGRPK